MVVSLTSLRLKSLWGFFVLSWWGFKITLQARKSKGFVQMKNTGSGYLHFTASIWESVEDAKAFAHSGQHLRAMKEMKSFANEVRILTFPGHEIPDWKEVRNLLEQKGRVF